MIYFIMAGIIVVMIILWAISLQRSLVVMDENINNAMSQIGIQLSSRWDALTCMLDLTKGYAAHDYNILAETIKVRRSVTGHSNPEDINKQENVITGTLAKIMEIAENYPELKANKTYLKSMDAVNQYETMVRASRLIYNDSITKLNRAIRGFPAILIAGILGFSKREYLKAAENRTKIPAMK